MPVEVEDRLEHVDGDVNDDVRHNGAESVTSGSRRPGTSIESYEVDKSTGIPIVDRLQEPSYSCVSVGRVKDKLQDVADLMTTDSVEDTTGPVPTVNEHGKTSGQVAMRPVGAKEIFPRAVARPAVPRASGAEKGKGEVKAVTGLADREINQLEDEGKAVAGLSKLKYSRPTVSGASTSRHPVSRSAYSSISDETLAKGLYDMVNAVRLFYIPESALGL